MSVIVPVCNAEKTLERSLESLLGQTLRDMEIVIVDDGSSDASAAIIRRYAESSAKVIHVSLLHNQGVHEARLAGIGKASSHWIGFLDADDIARPSMFETMFRAATDQEADIVICGSHRVTEARRPIAPKVKFRKDERIASSVFEQFSSFRFGTGSLWNKLYRREVIVSAAERRFLWRQDTNEDLLLNIGCFLQAKSVYLLRDVLHEYVLNQESVTSTNSRAKAFTDTLRAYAIAMNLYEDKGERVLEGITHMYRVQLGWKPYRVDDIVSLAEFHMQLKQAAEVISRVYPLGLALLAAQSSEQTSLVNALKVKSRKLLRSFVGLH